MVANIEFFFVTKKSFELKLRSNSILQHLYEVLTEGFFDTDNAIVLELSYNKLKYDGSSTKLKDIIYLNYKSWIMANNINSNVFV